MHCWHAAPADGGAVLELWPVQRVAGPMARRRAEGPRCLALRLTLARTADQDRVPEVVISNSPEKEADLSTWWKKLAAGVFASLD